MAVFTTSTRVCGTTRHSDPKLASKIVDEPAFKIPKGERCGCRCLQLARLREACTMLTLLNNSLNDLCARVKGFLQAIPAAHKPQERVLVVCHGGVVRAMLACGYGTRAAVGC